MLPLAGSAGCLKGWKRGPNKSPELQGSFPMNSGHGCTHNPCTCAPFFNLRLGLLKPTIETSFFVAEAQTHASYLILHTILWTLFILLGSPYLLHLTWPISPALRTGSKQIKKAVVLECLGRQQQQQCCATRGLGCRAWGVRVCGVRMETDTMIPHGFTGSTVLLPLLPCCSPISQTGTPCARHVKSSPHTLDGSCVYT